MAKGPVLISLKDSEPAKEDVYSAPLLPDPMSESETARPQGQAMQAGTKLLMRKPSKMWRFGLGLVLALIGAMVSVAVWDFMSDVMLRWPVLGWGLRVMMGVLLLIVLAFCLQELAALGRLSRIDRLQKSAALAVETNDLAQASQTLKGVLALYKGREDTRWGCERFQELSSDQMDAAGLQALGEREIMAPLDAQVCKEIESAARQVATVTALVPLAFVDVATALSRNIRMIRRIAEIYGGRAGFLGNWRLSRAVMAHLVATGAMAVGDDLLEPFLGGSLLGKLSRRFGEGLVNGALTARVGIAAMEVCRPLPFHSQDRPKAGQLVRKALGGLFSQAGSK